MDAPVWRWSFLGVVGAVMAGTILVHQARLPTGPEGYYNRGVEDNRRGRYEAAIANFDRSLALDAERADAYVARAVSWSRLERPFRALTDADEALRREPDSSRAFYVRGRALWRIGREDAALEEYERALQLDPRFARAALERASILLDDGRYGESLDAARRAWELRAHDRQVDHAPWIAWAARTLAGDAVGADRELDGTLRLQPPADVAIWMEGVRRLAAGDAASALARFREAAAAEKGEPWCRERAWSAAESLVLGLRTELVNTEISETLSFGPGLKVRCLREAGPAERAGLALGDRLVRIDGAEATESRIAELVRTAPWGTGIACEAVRGEENLEALLRPASSAPTR